MKLILGTLIITPKYYLFDSSRERYTLVHLVDATKIFKSINTPDKIYQDVYARNYRYGNIKHICATYYGFSTEYVHFTVNTCVIDFICRPSIDHHRSAFSLSRQSKILCSL